MRQRTGVDVVVVQEDDQAPCLVLFLNVEESLLEVALCIYLEARPVVSS